MIEWNDFMKGKFTLEELLNRNEMGTEVIISLKFGGASLETLIDLYTPLLPLSEWRITLVAW